MLIENVKRLSTFERLRYWITERESIRLKKESGKPKPWTDDRILQSYRFTNVRRMDDKVSRWLLDNWFRPFFGHRNMTPAVVIARHFNKIETLERIGFPERYDPKRMKASVKALRGEGHKVFGAAYTIRASGDYPDKVDMVFDETVKAFVDDPPKLDTSSMRKCVRVVSGYRNFGSFMAGQVVADLRHAISGTWKDRMTWAPRGPGSKRGLNRLWDEDVSEPMTDGTFYDRLEKVVKEMLRVLPEGITSRLEAHDFQNCLCEFDKYERCLNGEGRPKQLYPGGRP